MYKLINRYINKILLKIIIVLLFITFLVPISIAYANDSDPTVVSVSLGMFHGVALKDDGTVWAWGAPYPGRDASYIGIGTNDTGSNMIWINITNVTEVSASYNYCLALKDDGTVWAWGYNNYGQLGDGTFIDSSYPVQVKNLNDIVAISASGVHNMALDKDGAVWTWGRNLYGQLGDGTIGDKYGGQNTPVKANVSNVKAIAGGTNFCEVIKDDGTVWGWGDNRLGHLGNTHINETILYPIQVHGISNVIKISSSSDQTIAITDDGAVWEWGYIQDNQLNQTRVLVPRQVSGLADIVAVSAGQVHSLALDNTGRVYVWGSNIDGQIGEGSDASYVQADPKQLPALSEIIGISAGTFNSAAIGRDGTVYEWGRNMEGQIDPASANEKITSPIIILKGTDPAHGLGMITAPTSTITTTAPAGGSGNPAFSDNDLVYPGLVTVMVMLIAAMVGCYLYIVKKK